MSAIVFRTRRLVVRRWCDADVPALAAVYGDADAMRWVGDGEPITAAACVRWLEVTSRNYAERGYGMFALERHTEPGVIGFCGIVHPGGQVEPEIKYALRRMHWGHGYATEAVAGLLRYGAAVHGLREIIATVAPANTASHRVLLQVGMLPGALRPHDDAARTRLFRWHPAPDAA